VIEKDAIALFDFKARNEKELSLKKGDTVLLHTRVSSEWWRGSSGGHTGLIPHSYVAVQTRCALCSLQTLVISDSISCQVIYYFIASVCIKFCNLDLNLLLFALCN